jgi:tRNA-dihydrouridine synthase C
VTFPNGALLAPMEGITDRCYRDLLLDAIGGPGGACTEFQRISTSVLPRRTFRRELGEPPRGDVPVGVQIMAAGTEHLARSVENAVAAGAPWIDLNFGCPVKRVFKKCAGSALLADPELLGAIVAETVAAADVPVTAKIRAGVEDDTRLDDVLDACAEAGAAGVILHARLRRHAYSEPARWEWIAHAVDRLRPRGVALVGNGGVDVAADVQRMLDETDCDAVMIGRGAFANPWIFREAAGGPPPAFEEAKAFATAYLHALCPPGGAAAPLARFKQLLRWYAAAGFDRVIAPDLPRLLRERDPEVVRDWLARATAPEPIGSREG